MKKLLFLLLLSLISISSFAADSRFLGINFEGSEPSGKKYYLEVSKPDGYKDRNYQKYQYIIWKILKDKGYERTSYENADIIIKTDFHEYVFNSLMGDVTNGRKIVDLDLYAYPKKYNEETIPYWKISMQKGGQIIMHFLYYMDLLWFQEGFHFIEYLERWGKNIDDNWSLDKIKIKDTNKKYKLSSDEIKSFNIRIKELNSQSEVELYNSNVSSINL